MKHEEFVFSRLEKEAEQILREMELSDRGSEDYAQLAANLDKVLELENRVKPKSKVEKIIENGPLLGLITGLSQIGLIVVAEAGGNLLLNTAALRFVKK